MYRTNNKLKRKKEKKKKKRVMESELNLTVCDRIVLLYLLFIL